VNREEIADYGWYSRRDVDRQIAAERERFAPWFLLEWEQLKRYSVDLARLAS
jgi:isopentenyldiphosphate isomerase